ncbi:MAG: fumarylacetoacetate hydrolase family protein [Pseudomonadota bacterium]
MRYARLGPAGEEIPVAYHNDGTARDLRSLINDLEGQYLDPDALSNLTPEQLEELPIVDSSLRFGPPVAGIGKFICVGLNYAQHAAESGMPAPEQPVLFMKATSTIQGPNDDVVIPKGSEKTDWEVELGVVIGRTCRHFSEDDALGHVAGYLVVNDLSERAFQLEHGGQWVKGKSCDTFGPIGPFLVTPDDVPNPQGLDLWLDVNGKRQQQSNTRDMIFGVAELITYISKYMTLEPGDIISTGTPSGVGLGLKPPVYLKPGDTMELGIEGLGQQRQTTIAYDPVA